VPNLSLNLLSVGQLCELGLELHFSKRDCDVQDPQTGQLIGTTHKIGRLFELSSLHLPPIVSVATTFRSPSTTFSLWHSRLGHASVSRIRSLAASGCSRLRQNLMGLLSDTRHVLCKGVQSGVWY
jgi:hypothetical protein